MVNYLKIYYHNFKHWMRYQPPSALSRTGWNSFNAEFKKNAPIRFWLTNDFRRKFILPMVWKYESMYNWVSYRTVDRYHVIKTGLAPGYADKDTQMLHVNFNLLKDFVEVEVAIREYWGSDETKSWCSEHMPFYHIMFPFRRPELGIKYLEWSSTLDDPSLPPYERSDQQAISARETLELYYWWVNERPARTEVKIQRESLGIFDDDFDRTSDEYKQYSEDVKSHNTQSERWDNEDTEYLIRLMKIRNSLWT